MSSDQTAPAPAPEAEELQWPVVVKLKRPIDHADERIASLQFRRGKLGDLKGMKIGELPSADQLMLLASRMCAQPLKVIEMLDGDDAEEVMALAIIFYAKCLPAGARL